MQHVSRCGNLSLPEVETPQKSVSMRAVKWGYLPEVPEFLMLREPEKDPVFMAEDDFNAIYKACESARYPAGRPYAPAVWWRALITLGIMTGMRKEEMLLLCWDACHLDEGFLKVRHSNTKGKRDERFRCIRSPSTTCGRSPISGKSSLTGPLGTRPYTESGIGFNGWLASPCRAARTTSIPPSEMSTGSIP